MNKKQKFIIIIISSVIVSFFLIDNLGNKLNKQLNAYVNIESKRLVTNIVNDSVNKVLEENIGNDLFIITRNSDGKVELLEYNTQKVNSIIKLINKNIKDQLIKLEEGKISDFDIANGFKIGKYASVKKGVICEISLGSLKNNAFYSNYGPYIPIKMTFQGSVNSRIETKLTSYGFNSLVIEVFLVSEVEQRISLPISSEQNKITIEAPLTLKIIQGLVPEQYYEKQLEKSYQQSE